MKKLLFFALAALTLALSACDKPEEETQTEEKPYVQVQGGQVAVSASGGTCEVKLLSNCDFEVKVEESSADWIHFVETKTVETSTLVFKVDANPTALKRSGKALVKCGSGLEDREIVFNQEAGDGPDKEVLMKIYKDMGGNSLWLNWGTDKTVSDWYNIEVEDGRVVSLTLAPSYYDPNTMNVKGEISPHIAELTALKRLTIGGQGIVGEIPEFIGEMSTLERLTIDETSLSGGLPDFFAGLPDLKSIRVYGNAQLTGSLPESLSECDKLESVMIACNDFTGSVPESYYKIPCALSLFQNSLTGKFPIKLFESEYIRESFVGVAAQGKPGHIYYLDCSDLPYIPSEPDDTEYKTFAGSSFKTDDIFKANKYTIRVYWGMTRPYCKELMAQVKVLYEKYHDKGLEVIADWFFDTDYAKVNEVKEFITANGYDKWQNINPYATPPHSYPMVCPAAEVFDQETHLLFTYVPYDETFHIACNQTATYDLAPFISSLFGDLDPNYESTDYSKDGEVLTLQKATVGKGINIVLLGDAYVDKDMVAGGHFESMMNSVMEEFFAIEPYKSFRNWFNVYTVKAVSKNCMIGEGKETVFRSSQEIGRTLTGNVDKCFEYALKVPGITSKENLTIITMVNNYSGGASTTGVYAYNSGVSFVSTYNDLVSFYGDIVRHEGCGHGFGHLADEYVEIEGEPSTAHKADRIHHYQERGWWANVDYTSDRSQIKWAHFLNDSRYDGLVGIYEGADCYSKGAYRPTEDSIMNASNKGEFNAPSREAIYKRIMELGGESYSFEKFSEYDAINR